MALLRRFRKGDLVRTTRYLVVDDGRGMVIVARPWDEGVVTSADDHGDPETPFVRWFLTSEWPVPARHLGKIDQEAVNISDDEERE